MLPLVTVCKHLRKASDSGFHRKNKNRVVSSCSERVTCKLNQKKAQHTWGPFKYATQITKIKQLNNDDEYITGI